MSTTFLGDLKHAALRGQSYPPQSITTSPAAGSGVDMRLSDGPIHMLVNYGAFTGVYTVLTFAIQESKDNGVTDAWTAVVDAAGSIALGLQNTQETVGEWKRSKRWVRAVCTATSGTTALISVEFMSRLKQANATGGQSLQPTSA